MYWENVMNEATCGWDDAQPMNNDHEHLVRAYHIIMEKEKILSRWYGYISVLYNDDRGDIPEIVSEEAESPITQREVEHALRWMPMKKSTGPDDITTEMLVAVGNIGIT